jgi:hypothetical protein
MHLPTATKEKIIEALSLFVFVMEQETLADGANDASASI